MNYNDKPSTCRLYVLVNHYDTTTTPHHTTTIPYISLHHYTQSLAHIFFGIRLGNVTISAAFHGVLFKRCHGVRRHKENLGHGCTAAVTTAATVTTTITTTSSFQVWLTLFAVIAVTRLTHVLTTTPLDDASGVHAIQPWHADIHPNHVVICLDRHINGFLAVLGVVHLGQRPRSQQDLSKYLSIHQFEVSCCACGDASMCRLVTNITITYLQCGDKQHQFCPRTQFTVDRDFPV